MTQANIDYKAWVGLILMAVLVIGSFTWMSGDTIVDNDVTNVDNEALQAAVIAAVESALVTNATSIEDRLVDIEVILNEDDAWEDEAEKLALEELEDDSYEDLADWMIDVAGGNLSLIDEDDIEEVIVKEVTITNANTDDKDATVTFELKVYYEDIDGNDLKEYINVEYVIEDEDVEGTTFVLA